MFGWKRAAAVAVAASLALAGCSGGGDNGGGGGGGNGGGDGAGGTLTLGVLVPASTFAAKDARWANESPYMQAVYDSLLKATPEGEIEPNLATEWSWNEDRTVLTMTLRDDVTFTDGEKLTADAAAKSILAFRDGTSPNKSNLASVADARAVDETTLEITLSAPDPALETYLTQNAGLVSSPAADPASIETEPVGSGPYTLNTGDTVVGSSYVFDASEDYWNPDDQHYAKIVMNVYADTTSQLNAIQGRQVNVSGLSDNTQRPQVEGAGYTAESNELDWEGLILADREGTLAPAMAEVEVRQAINYALDREALLQALIGGYGTTTTQVFPTYSTSFDDELDSFYEYDVDKAKELMAEAGYADGFDVTMPRASGLPASTFTLIADQLAQIGINVTFEDLATNAFIDGVLAAKFPLTWFRLQQDPSDYQLAQFQISSTATWNLFKTNDPTVEGLIGQLRTGDEATAEQAGKELNTWVVENAWFAPFYRFENTKAVDADTTVEMQAGNTWPYLWNIQPK